MRKRLRNENELPIVLMAPIEINSWLQFYDKNIENICSELTIVPNGALVRLYLLTARDCKMRVELIIFLLAD